jgi:hypothetical protein
MFTFKASALRCTLLVSAQALRGITSIPSTPPWGSAAALPTYLQKKRNKKQIYPGEGYRTKRTRIDRKGLAAAKV